MSAGKTAKIAKISADIRTIDNAAALYDIESEIVGNNSKMKEVFNLIYRLSKVETTVLIRGENGTGKELYERVLELKIK
jgi:DNA-binding NtrC family response regulator